MPDQVVGVAPIAFTGPAGEYFFTNPKVTITERRALDEFREDPVAYVDDPLPPKRQNAKKLRASLL